MNSVHNNTITYLGKYGSSGLSGDTVTATGMIFDCNEYHIFDTKSDRWRWGGSKSITEMRQMGFELRGKILQTSHPDVLKTH